MADDAPIDSDVIVHFQVVRDLLMEQIGYHNRCAVKHGESTPLGCAHLKAIDTLVELRRSLRITNRGQINSVDLAVQAMIVTWARELEE